jgi:Nitrous oxide-stimulated promoter
MNATGNPIRPGRDRPATPRLLRELETIEAMTRIYCADHHRTPTPCADCQSLMTYAAKRLALCTFGEEKPVCAKCQVHCYGKAMREKVREVMRYAGPRMIWRHPWLALMHVVDERYVAPPKPNAAARASEPAPATSIPTRAVGGVGPDRRPSAGLTADKTGPGEAAASPPG